MPILQRTLYQFLHSLSVPQQAQPPHPQVGPQGMRMPMQQATPQMQATSQQLRHLLLNQQVGTVMLIEISHYLFNGLVQERRNSSALAMELRFSCANPLIYGCMYHISGLVQDCDISNADALEILQSCTQPSIS